MPQNSLPCHLSCWARKSRWRKWRLCGELKVINPHKTTLRKKYIWFDTISGLRYNSLINKEWREGVGVEPTRDVYSPILDLKSRRPTGTSTLP